VCHAGALCGDTGTFLLSTREVSFVNKKGEKEFVAAPSAVTSEGPVLFRGRNAWNGQALVASYLQIKFGKNWRFYYLPKAVRCSLNNFCPEPGLTQQSMFAQYVHATLVRMAAGEFEPRPSVR
jgi:hypothetical protein